MNDAEKEVMIREFIDKHVADVRRRGRQHNDQKCMICIGFNSWLEMTSAEREFYHGIMTALNGPTYDQRGK